MINFEDQNEEEYGSTESNKRYIVSMVEQMDDSELDTFDTQFRLIDKRETLTAIITKMDVENENDMDVLSRIYSYIRDNYYSEF